MQVNPGGSVDVAMVGMHGSMFGLNFTLLAMGG